jgi:hypothetical protein
MTLQDQIDSFQKLVFSHFRHGLNNDCRISSLVPLVQESYGIYKFITSMLRAMHTSMYIRGTYACAREITFSKQPAMTKLWHRFATDTKANTIAWSASITNVRIYDT